MISRRIRPLVQPLIHGSLNRRLGLIFEAKVGKGKLMVVSADLQTDLENRPAPDSFGTALRKYMQSGNSDQRKRWKSRWLRIYSKLKKIEKIAWSMGHGVGRND